jgi:hypothetical protein
MRTWLFVSLVIFIGFIAYEDQAQAQKRWVEQGEIPLPGGKLTAFVPSDDLALFDRPGGKGKRRGSAMMGSRLPVFGARRMPGCSRRWLLVGPSAWVCQDNVNLQNQPAMAATDVPWDAPDGLPFRYYFVGRNGSQGYRSLQLADISTPVQELQQGFAMAMVEEARRGRERYGFTHHGLWVPMRDLIPVRPFLFHGETIHHSLDVAWIVVDKAYVYKKPQRGVRTSDFKTRFEVVHVQEVKGSGTNTFYRIGTDQWLWGKDVRHPKVSEPPKQVLRGERWIDVDLSTQTLVAYEGKKPVFATIVSTGKGRQGSARATPKGVHRIWVKLRSATMDNLEDEWANSNYAIEDVPYVQYFSKGVGLHGAFWHKSFGYVRSHGCVNLAPLDALHLFSFTTPYVPAGWSAALPTRRDLGTVVRVR